MVAGGARTVAGLPPDISQLPPHCPAVSGPQPVVSGRELGPPPTKCGPGLVATPHSPLEHCAASTHPPPLATLPPPGQFGFAEPEEPFVPPLSTPPQAETATK